VGASWRRRQLRHRRVARYRLHPFETIYGGLVAHPFQAAKDVLTFVRDFAPTLSDEGSIAAGLIHAPDGSGVKLAAYLLFHTGEPEQAQAEFQPALSFGPPVITQVGPMPYPVMNTLLDDGYPRGALNYWKSTFQLARRRADRLAGRRVIASWGPRQGP
jgi:hypothetical protein